MGVSLRDCCNWSRCMPRLSSNLKTRTLRSSAIQFTMTRNTHRNNVKLMFLIIPFGGIL